MCDFDKLSGEAKDNIRVSLEEHKRCPEIYSKDSIYGRIALANSIGLITENEKEEFLKELSWGFANK